MANTDETPVLSLYSTTPQSKDVPSDEYLDAIVERARWADDLGYAGTLIYTDNGIVDPWFLAQIVIQNTEQLTPLIATQPAYMHPYTCAKLISTLAYVHHRRVCLNMVAGGFTHDLQAMGAHTPHDERYLRLQEYTEIVLALAAGERPVTLDGDYYQVTNLTLTPPVPAELSPGIFLSGTSEQGLATARALDAVEVRYPRPADIEDVGTPGRSCVRVGIIVRDTEEQAWEYAHERFPPDRKGELTHQVAMKVSDSSWHQTLSERDESWDVDKSFWLHPFQSYKTFCPYLVGSYEQVAESLAAYMSRGYWTFILDIPESREEMEQTIRAFEQAQLNLNAPVS